MNNNKEIKKTKAELKKLKKEKNKEDWKKLKEDWKNIGKKFCQDCQKMTRIKYGYCTECNYVVNLKDTQRIYFSEFFEEFLTGWSKPVNFIIQTTFILCLLVLMYAIIMS